MQKSLLAAAVAAVFAAPAFAQTSNVTLYGRANVGIDTYRASDATAGGSASFKSRSRVFDSSSRLGVRGVEDLGNGLRAVFQIESGTRLDAGNNLNSAGATDASSGTLASRPSFAGLEGSFGRVLWGRQDVYWGNGTIAQTGANYINTEVSWYSGGNTGLVNMGVARQSNVMSYTTPQLGPVNVSLYWSPDTNASGGGSGASSAPGTCATQTGFSNAECQGAGLNTNARLWAGTARFAMGPVAAQLDYVQKEGRSDQAIIPKNTGIKGGVGFSYMPGAQISLIMMQVKTLNALNNTDNDFKQTSWGINWEHIIGNVQLLAQYGQQGKVSGCGANTTTFTNGTSTTNFCNDSTTKGWLVAARYLMSKRTALYATYTEMRNGANAFADYTGGGYTPAALGSTNRGADPRVIGAGIIHNF